MGSLLWVTQHINYTGNGLQNKLLKLSASHELKVGAHGPIIIDLVKVDAHTGNPVPSLEKRLLYYILP